MQQIITDYQLFLFYNEKLEHIIKAVEKDLTMYITQALLAVTITIEQAKQIVRYFFALLPIQNMKELVSKLHSFSNNYPICTPLYAQYGKSYDDHMRTRKAAYLAACLRCNEIDSAYIAMKGDILW
jgi:hypothetical protein